MDTTSYGVSPRSAFRRGVSAVVCGMMLAGAVSPAGSQEGGRRRLAGVRADSVQMAKSRTGGFWAWLFEEAKRVRELNGGPLAFATRYRTSPELARQIHDVAREEGIDPELGFRVVRVESAFNPMARSRVGALGLTQLMPSTARWLQRGITREEILEPRTNLRIGFRYLRGLINKYDGDLELALLAYNRGDGAVDRDLRRGRNPENGYSRQVLGTGLSRYGGTGLVQR